MDPLCPSTGKSEQTYSGPYFGAARAGTVSTAVLKSNLDAVGFWAMWNNSTAWKCWQLITNPWGANKFSVTGSMCIRAPVPMRGSLCKASKTRFWETVISECPWTQRGWHEDDTSCFGHTKWWSNVSVISVYAQFWHQTLFSFAYCLLLHHLFVLFCLHSSLPD